MKIQIGDFQGKPFMTLVEEQGRYKTELNFGIKKAKMILAAIDHIKEFVAKYDKPVPPQSKPDRETIAELQLKEE